MDKNKIIEFLGSEEIYDEYKNLVINELKRQIDFYELTTHFEGTNVYEQFADFYIQGWMHNNQRFVDEVCELKKEFSQEEISQYISENPLVPQDILEISWEELYLSFEGKELPTELKQKKEAYYKNPQLLSEEEAREEMKKNNEDEISRIMESFDLQHFKDTLKSRQIHFLNVDSNPINVSIGKRGTKSVLKENPGSKTSILELPEGEEYDFDVNSEQIFILGFPEGYPHIYAYFPDKEYPEGMLRSTLIQQDNYNKFIKKFLAQYEGLYTEFKGKVDLDKLPIMQNLKDILPEK